MFYFLTFFILSFSFNFVNSSLYLFLIVTSVTPAMSATSLCVLFSLLIKAATYNEAAAIPVGPLPEVNSELSAISKISTDFDCVSADNFNAEANLGMYSTGLLGRILMPNSLVTNL